MPAFAEKAGHIAGTQGIGRIEPVGLRSFDVQVGVMDHQE